MGNSALQLRFARPAVLEVDIVLPVDVRGVIAKDPVADLDDLLASLIPRIVNDELLVTNVLGLEFRRSIIEKLQPRPAFLIFDRGELLR